jgi:hypothetical protein
MSTATFDPFKGVDIQTKRYRAHCRILVAGVDVTDRIEPHLISVRVISGSPFTAEIELDDRDARLPAPPMNAPVNIELGWASESIINVFNGSISKKESAFGRKQGGRRMFIHAEGPNWMSDIKTPFQDTLGTGTEPGQQMGQQHSMEDWLKQVSGSGGGSAVVSPGFGGVTRDHWQQNNTSPVQVFQELAHKFGGVFNITSGNRFLFLKPGEGGGGSVTGNVIAKWGDNMISWRIDLDSARSMWQGANQQFFDTAKAQGDKATGGGGAGGGGGGAGGGVGAARASAQFQRGPAGLRRRTPLGMADQGHHRHQRRAVGAVERQHPDWGPAVDGCTYRVG